MTGSFYQFFSVLHTDQAADDKDCTRDTFYDAPSPMDVDYSSETVSEEEDTIFNDSASSAPLGQAPQTIQTLLLASRTIDTPPSTDTDDQRGVSTWSAKGTYPIDHMENQETLEDKNTQTFGRSAQEGANDATHLPRNTNIKIRQAELRYPKSQYDGFIPPLPICKERIAVNELLQEFDRLEAIEGRTSPRPTSTRHDEDFIEIELSDFVVYRPDNPHHPFEFVSLKDLASKDGRNTFLFDGILHLGNVRQYVQAVPFVKCSIGNYGMNNDEVGDDIWIQSLSLAKSEVWYRLKSPAQEYARFYEGFIWLANLGKHFTDYCQASFDGGKLVTVHHFQKDFSQWLKKTHRGSSSFQDWYQQYQGNDFRRAVAADIHFLFKESLGVDDRLLQMPIWKQLKWKNFIPLQEPRENTTIVTPYVMKCFEHLRFGHLLKSVEPTIKAQGSCASQARSLDLTVDQALTRPVVEISTSKSSTPSSGLLYFNKNVSIARRDADVLAQHSKIIQAVKAGDVLSVTKDGEGSVWKDETSRWKAEQTCWYIYVQAVHELENGKRSFAGLWLYHPSETHCAKMKYPFPNELFLSDNCSCSEGPIPEDRVLDIVTVSWHGQPSAAHQGLFVRQTYIENEKFVTLKDSHKQCEHFRRRTASPTAKRARKYSIGQTVFAAPSRCNPEHTLEAYEIIGYVEESSKTFATLRCLARRNRIQGQGTSKPNELVYTDQIRKVEVNSIKGTCLVRFYTEKDIQADLIPVPYNRDGTANAFYITTRLAEVDGRQQLIPYQNDFPKTLLQGFNPLDPLLCGKLRGLDLYCGGGNFGRGLEEGGALHNEWAVDYAQNQVHTYYANLEEPSATKFYYGSVNDQLYQALQGNPKNSKLVPKPGEVDFISAGNPCQGFSVLNTNRNNEKGLRNQSLVASVAAYIDFYRPKYGILENVMTMAQKGLGRDEDVLSQLICCIVGMGYQLQLFVLDAWSCGSPQSRSRLFVSFAAPGYQPLEHPELSHSHPSNITDRGLGKLANGEPFGRRRKGPTPFPYVTAELATKDLPSIGDGLTNQCIKFPDHVLPIGLSNEIRLQIAAIPKHPKGSSFSSAWNEGKGVMTKEQRDLFPKSTRDGKVPHCVQKQSKAWGRVHPQKLFGTIVVSTGPRDARMGTCLHWEEQRVLTIMEARRAQGFPDEEVLVGSASDKWKIIGNSVARTVSLTLGISLREAWFKTCLGDQNDTQGESEAVAVRNMVPASTPSTRPKATQPAVVTIPREDEGAAIIAKNLSSADQQTKHPKLIFPGAMRPPRPRERVATASNDSLWAVQRSPSPILPPGVKRPQQSSRKRPHPSKDQIPSAQSIIYPDRSFAVAGLQSKRSAERAPVVARASLPTLVAVKTTRPAVVTRPQQRYLITDSEESSNSDSLSEVNARRPMGAFPLRSSSNRVPGAAQNPIEAGDSLKRSREIQETRILPSMHHRPRPAAPSVSRELDTAKFSIKASNPLKRLPEVQETRILPHGYGFKAPRISSPSSKPTGVNATGLNGNQFQKAANEQANGASLSQKLQGAINSYFADGDDDDDDDYEEVAESESESEEDTVNGVVSISPNSFASPEHHHRVHKRIITTQSMGASKNVSKVSSTTESRKQSFIDLTLDDEEGDLPVWKARSRLIDLVSDTEDDHLPVFKGATRPGILSAPNKFIPNDSKASSSAFHAPPQKYVAVDNSAFEAYAQTNRVMNGDRFRKHGPKHRS